ncbi:hypothetical protein ACN24M_39525 [Streptomyces microflavus]
MSRSGARMGAIATMSARLSPAAGAMRSAFAFSYPASAVILRARSVSSFSSVACVFLMPSRRTRSSASCAL